MNPSIDVKHENLFTLSSSFVYQRSRSTPMPERSNNPYGRRPDDPNGPRVSMHIRMRPSIKATLKDLSEKTGRSMIEIPEDGVAVQEPKTEFGTSRGRLHLPTREAIEHLKGDTNGLKPKKSNRVNGGAATNNLILSCHRDGNDSVFARIIKLYVKEGSRIADCTYGKGVFWKIVETTRYNCFFSDLKNGVLPDEVPGGIDSRRLPHDNKSLDALVFDPPYMHTPAGTAHNGHQNFQEYYANNVEIDKEVAIEIWELTNGQPLKYQESVLDLYFRSAR